MHIILIASEDGGELMSRLAKRLKKAQMGLPTGRFTPPPPPAQPPEMTPDQQDEYNKIYDDYNQTLSDEYDRNQEKAQAYEKQLQNAEKNNPHQLEGEMRADPTPKGIYEIDVQGRKIDLAMLEDYV